MKEILRGLLQWIIQTVVMSAWAYFGMWFGGALWRAYEAGRTGELPIGHPPAIEGDPTALTA